LASLNLLIGAMPTRSAPVENANRFNLSLSLSIEGLREATFWVWIFEALAKDQLLVPNLER